jgi:hypothetical protein
MLVTELVGFSIGLDVDLLGRWYRHKLKKTEITYARMDGVACSGTEIFNKLKDLLR